jgi:hypothetical protein
MTPIQTVRAGPMERGHRIAVRRDRIDAEVEEEIRDLRSAELARPHERKLDVRLGLERKFAPRWRDERNARL